MDLNRALELEPNIAPTLVMRAQVYLALQRQSDALRDLERAHQLEPNDTQIASRYRWLRQQLADSS
jgi:cytochrome c-type biogenesis protein CcmH/NrfG